MLEGVCQHQGHTLAHGLHGVTHTKEHDLTTPGGPNTRTRQKRTSYSGFEKWGWMECE